MNASVEKKAVENKDTEKQTANRKPAENKDVKARMRMCSIMHASCWHLSRQQVQDAEL